MNLKELNGKSLALILSGEDEDWSVLRGIVRQEGEVLLLDHSAGQAFHIQPEWLDRIKPIPADLSDILMNADFFLPLSVGPLPEDADPSDYINTGLKLPEGVRGIPTGSIQALGRAAQGKRYSAIEYEVQGAQIHRP